LVAQSDSSPDPAAASLEYTSSFVDRLSTLGVQHACICPGSRSTPLTLAFVGHSSIRTWMHIDERSAGYFALGMAKSLRSPVALVCTSGTAAANFMPAVVEARHSCVPLLVCTADRPPELRDTGALQSIDQLKLYGSFVKWFAEMATPDESPATLRYAESVATHAVRAAMGTPSGPVHLNFPFREPLVPKQQRPKQALLSRNPTPISTSTHQLNQIEIAHLADRLRASHRGLIVCGPQDQESFTESMSALAEATGFPIAADPLSQLRCGFPTPTRVIDHYDIFLRSADARRILAPDLVLRFGMTPTSKALLTFLSALPDAYQVSVTSNGISNDPTRVVDEVNGADAPHFGSVLASLVGSGHGEKSKWLELWQRADDTVRSAISARFSEPSGLSEPLVSQTLSEIVPPNALLYVGNSMPVRDLDGFFPSRSAPLRIMANRGVNGIDGVVSSALGAGAALNQRVVLVIGDLSFYHDLNGLLATKLHKLDATIILLNNNGGGIFSFLPQAMHTDTFEPNFAVPTCLDFEPAVAMYGGTFQRLQTVDELRDAVATAAETPGLSVLEIFTDRTQNVRDHEAVWNEASASLANALVAP
jgi:2-succinyl-5-enolpyruvyl-6-hydroxy-3-cyclohexene-1-carboxylate synthase